MYQINQKENRIAPLEIKSFSELGFYERENLQEWIAHSPEVLGEELLIIQKEFDGFDDTRERLDLLALDKEGNLVIIENKLDDTGRDVVWQALKYASYCSSLTKAQIVQIYQEYLNKYDPGGDAQSLLENFLETEDLDETLMNTGLKQRLMFVAANFRKEVTSTAIWLLGHGVDLQCFKATPYKLDDQTFLNVDQIIPTPEVKDLMIGMSAKEADEKASKANLRRSYQVRLEFWEKAIEAINNSPCQLFKNISPITKDNWLSAATGLSGVRYALAFCKNEVRVELSIERASQAENKEIFDQLYAQREEIETNYGNELTWKRLNDKKLSRIVHIYPCDGYDKDNWDNIISWLCKQVHQLEGTFQSKLNDINSEMKKAR